MKKKKKPTAIKKRASQKKALGRFAFHRLLKKLPFTFPREPDWPDSPKPRYRSTYRYLGHEDLARKNAWSDMSPFYLYLRLFDYSHLEPLLAAHFYRRSAKGQTPFHPVSMYLLILYRRYHQLSRPETVRRLRDPDDGGTMRRFLGFSDDFPSESGLRHVEKQLSPRLQQEINAQQIDLLYQAGLLPTQPGNEQKVYLSFDGMLHEARSHMRCAHTQASCYQKAPRVCPARKKGKRGCTCQEDDCEERCQHAPRLDPDARLVVYTGNNKRRDESPNSNLKKQPGKKRASRLVYGYYSYCGQLLDEALSTYWALPAGFGPATQGDRTRFPEIFPYLRERFGWLKIKAVMADAGAGYQNCLDLIWEAGALRMVDIVASAGDKDPAVQLARGYDENGYPLCPFGYVMRSNGHDYARRRTKWRCSKQCLLKPADKRPACDCLQQESKHGYTVSIGRCHDDGSVRLAREIPYGSQSWKQLYHRRNCAESRNSLLEGLGLKRLPVHGLKAGHVVVLLADFITNQKTLIRLIREANALALSN